MIEWIYSYDDDGDWTQEGYHAFFDDKTLKESNSLKHFTYGDPDSYSLCSIIRHDSNEKWFITHFDNDIVEPIEDTYHNNPYKLMSLVEEVYEEYFRLFINKDVNVSSNISFFYSDNVAMNIKVFIPNYNKFEPIFEKNGKRI